MLFFQVILLAGYAYAHLVSRYLRPYRQITLHGVLLLIAMLLLPIVPADSWRPEPVADPTGQILLMLFANLGLPFLLLSATSPLLQAWFTVTHNHSSPYRLYAISNAGSLLALLSFPVFFEPNLSRLELGWFWSAAFIIFASLVLWLAWLFWRGSAHSDYDQQKDSETANTGKSSLWTRTLWILLPAVAVVMLLAVTNEMTQDIAVVPFLWILPLSIYLLSFIISFHHHRWYQRIIWIPVLFLTSGASAWLLFQPEETAITTQITVLSLLLLSTSMVCHGELFRLRPARQYLTAFYLALATGGALGGVFVALLAPVLFKAYFELHLGILACLILVLLILYRDPKSVMAAGKSKIVWIAVIIGFFSIAAVLANHARNILSGNIVISRNFYGVITIKDNPGDRPSERSREMWHGRILHGSQYLAKELQRSPTIYYSVDSGVGRLLQIITKPKRRIGLVGLGPGTLATYGRPGDVMRFYEINPVVTRLARDYFTYLKQSKAKIEIINGDARLSMERENPQDYDVIVLDAFNGDSIPVHLLTREAFKIYLDHLSPDGAIAVHISTWHLDLHRVLAQHANYFKMQHMLLIDKDLDSYGSYWVVLTRNKAIIRNKKLREIRRERKLAFRPIRPWTDDRANLFEILKFIKVDLD